jgi:hypothetical protein
VRAHSTTAIIAQADPIGTIYNASYP